VGTERQEWEELCSAQIVFSSMVNSRVRLDCVSESANTLGWPFTMVVDIPDTGEWSSLAPSMLGRWTSDARPLELQVDVDRSPFRVRISDGVNAMRLDLVDVCTKS